MKYLIKLIYVSIEQQVNLAIIIIIIIIIKSFMNVLY